MASVSKTIEHWNGTATTTPVTITFTNQSLNILIQNTEQSAANELLVSFDGGTTFKALRRLAAISIDAAILSFVVKASGGSVDYESVVSLDK